MKPLKPGYKVVGGTVAEITPDTGKIAMTEFVASAQEQAREDKANRLKKAQAILYSMKSDKANRCLTYDEAIQGLMLISELLIDLQNDNA